jgi:regulator of RNase E activity RraA
LDLPIYCTGFAPNAYAAQAVPQIAVPLDLAGARVEPGDLLMGDDDGIVCGSAEAMAAAIDKAEEIQSREEGLQRAIAGGQSIFEHMNWDEHLASRTAGRPSSLSLA